jgi:hypothetical protein
MLGRLLGVMDAELPASERLRVADLVHALHDNLTGKSVAKPAQPPALMRREFQLVLL